MGTSSARQAPVGKLWRTAKTYASRFAAGKEASPPKAAEVIARYSAALDSLRPETAGETGALLPDVIRTAAALGNFYLNWEQDGWEAALTHLGIGPAQQQDRDEIIATLLDRLAGPGATLDEAVARIALSHHFDAVLPPGAASNPEIGTAAPDCPESLAGVDTFLGLALHQKLLSDLGEPLEFYAPSLDLAYRRQEELKSHILATVQALNTALTPRQISSEEHIETLFQQLITHLRGQSDG